MSNSNSVIKDSKDELYSDDILKKKEEEMYKETIRKIIKASYLFQWMNEKLIMNLIIQSLSKKILKIEEVPAWKTIIKEGDKECDYFLLVLSGSYSIHHAWQQVWLIDTISVLWEVGFLDPSLWRTATVKTETTWHILKMNEYFLSKLSAYDFGLFYKNLAKCVSRKLITTTQEYSNLIKTWELISYNDNDCKVIKMDNYTENHGHAVRKFKHWVIHIL